VARLLREKPYAVLGLATGGTPLPLYRELARMHLEEGLDFRPELVNAQPARPRE